ncbi:alpha/beta-hydrolase [Meredithblackwellia eburnea MCA 4105]
MSFVDVPSRGLQVFYLQNPTNLGAVEPFGSPIKALNHPLDPFLPILLLVHGTCATSELFHPQFNDPRLKHFNLIALDARFHGRTTETAPTETFPLDQPPLHSPEDIGEDFEAALNALGLGEVELSILGLGRLGTRVASHLAAIKPKRTKALILISPGTFVEQPAVVKGVTVDWLEQLCRNKNGRGDGSGRMDCQKDLDNYMFGTLSISQDIKLPLLEHTETRYGEGHSERDVTGMLHCFARQAPQLDSLARITAPTLILAPSHDHNASEKGYQEWKASLTGVPGGASLVNVASAAVFATYTTPTVVNRVVLDFLGRQGVLPQKTVPTCIQ